MKMDRLNRIHRPAKDGRLAEAIAFCRENNAVLMCGSEEQAAGIRSEHGIRATYVKARADGR